MWFSFSVRSMINGAKHFPFYRPSCRQKLKRCGPKLFYVSQKERKRKWMTKAQRIWNNLPWLPFRLHQVGACWYKKSFGIILGLYGTQYYQIILLDLESQNTGAASNDKCLTKFDSTHMEKKSTSKIRRKEEKFENYPQFWAPDSPHFFCHKQEYDVVLDLTSCQCGTCGS